MASLCRRGSPVAATAAARRALSSAAGGRCGGSAAVVASQRPTGPPRASTSAAGDNYALSQPNGIGVSRIERRTFYASSTRRDEHVMDLPTMGDSISEGTIVQWCKAVGDAVAEDEVIAVVETDKVSVDVKSTHVGVVVKLFAAVDDVVEVGKPLCTIDGDEASVVRAKIEAALKEEEANAPPPKVKKPDLEDAYAGAFMAGADFVPPKKNRHEPLIKFLGKRVHVKDQVEPAKADAPTRHLHSPGALDFSQIVGGAMFGRPPMSEEEMDAVNSGGAEAAPQLRYIDGSRWAS